MGPQILQAAKAVSASQDALIDLFERIENIFRRLETYIEVPQASGMGDMTVKVMVEILFILAIATKEIHQNSASALILSDGPSVLAHRSPEAFLRKLVGRMDIEDALRRLDKLSQEEARMATAEGLKAAHSIDNKVEDVSAKVERVDDRVKDVGNKLIDGMQITFN